MRISFTATTKTLSSLSTCCAFRKVCKYDTLASPDNTRYHPTSSDITPDWRNNSKTKMQVWPTQIAVRSGIFSEKSLFLSVAMFLSADIISSLPMCFWGSCGSGDNGVDEIMKIIPNYFSAPQFSSLINFVISSVLWKFSTLSVPPGYRLWQAALYKLTGGDTSFTYSRMVTVTTSPLTMGAPS